MVVIAYMRVLHTKRAVLLGVLFNILTIKMLIMNSVISQTILVQCMTINRITDQYDVGFGISKYNLQMCTCCFTIWPKKYPPTDLLAFSHQRLNFLQIY